MESQDITDIVSCFPNADMCDLLTFETKLQEKREINLLWSRSADPTPNTTDRTITNHILLWTRCNDKPNIGFYTSHGASIFTSCTISTISTRTEWTHWGCIILCIYSFMRRQKRLIIITVTLWPLLVWLFWGFTAQSTLSMSCRAAQLTYSHCSWAGLDLLSGLPVLRVHTFSINWQLSFLNQRKGENGRWNYFMINLHKCYVARPGQVEPTTPSICSQTRCRLCYGARLCPLLNTGHFQSLYSID